MPVPVSDEFLERRVKALHNRLATIRLSGRGLEATAERLKQALSWSTVSVVETTVSGKAVRIVTTNDSGFYKLLKESPQTLLLPGEILGSRPTYVYGPKEPKKRPPRQTIHAEQLGVNDAAKMGATSGRIASSNPGCNQQCVALLTEEFPAFQHVNPARTDPDLTIPSGAATLNVPESTGRASGPSHPAGRDITSGQPAMKDRMTSARYLDSGTTADVERAVKAAERVADEPVAHRGARVMSHPAATKQAMGGVQHGLRIKSLTIGVKAWKAVRTVGKIVALCFVPLTALDVVLEVAFELWDREREKEERKRREKQKALEAVFKQGERVQSLIQSKILNNTPLFEEFVRNWDINKKYQGFLYARLSAELHIETFRDLGNMGKVSEALTTYTVVALDVLPTNWAHNFEFTEIGGEKVLDITEADSKRLLGQGIMHPYALRKVLQKKRLKYTIVPPLFTPFDIVTMKINNLFLDIASLVYEFNRAGTPEMNGFTQFNYNVRYDEQFTTALEFPQPLNQSVCRYCLSYLHWAAGQLSQHPLTQQDLEGNLEDPTKGRERRFWLLMALLEGRDTRYKKNFSFLSGQVKELVKAGGKSEEVTSALEELYTGARFIWYDLERIQANIGKPEYYYFGPNYKEPA